MPPHLSVKRERDTPRDACVACQVEVVDAALPGQRSNSMSGSRPRQYPVEDAEGYGAPLGLGGRPALYLRPVSSRSSLTLAIVGAYGVRPCSATWDVVPARRIFRFNRRSRTGRSARYRTRSLDTQQIQTKGASMRESAAQKWQQSCRRAAPARRSARRARYAWAAAVPTPPLALASVLPVSPERRQSTAVPLWRGESTRHRWFREVLMGSPFSLAADSRASPSTQTQTPGHAATRAPVNETVSVRRSYSNDKEFKSRRPASQLPMA